MMIKPKVCAPNITDNISPLLFPPLHLLNLINLSCIEALTSLQTCHHTPEHHLLLPASASSSDPAVCPPSCNQSQCIKRASVSHSVLDIRHRYRPKLKHQYKIRISNSTIFMAEADSADTSPLKASKLLNFTSCCFFSKIRKQVRIRMSL